MPSFSAYRDTLETRCRQFLYHFVAFHRPSDDILAVQPLLCEIDHADLAVLVGSEVEQLGLEIDGAGPQRVIGNDIAVLIFVAPARGAFRDVEIIEDVERLQDSVVARWRGQHRLAERHGADEPRW